MMDLMSCLRTVISASRNKLLSGRGSRGGMGIGSWLAFCHEFEPSTTKDPPCRRAAMHAKSVELKRPTPVGVVW
ncbi:hypothetical protein TNCV_1701481 [Trichonephila clavipes]|nr:hypothetical protein TNCV_1701481 [Trichonephila clavipes]